MNLFIIHLTCPSSPRGTASTVFLWLVDVKKSRVECEAFVRAETEREAFQASAVTKSALPVDAGSVTSSEV